MSPQTEPDYRTAYEKDKTLVCPETGTDLSEWSGDSIRAHAENLYPEYARENFSPEAKARKEALLAMAKERDK